ncbi:MAG TPA: hypothetical protein VFG42_10410 [Baekduia sp.]|uniref:hypothetical protein n=1 Tax=Baekduia sp. TaxID=2600305 RepID=UPI002D77A38A|nr:hypothetical protein [Baekduia sp.]HET6507194.1 hypothetical protein [Baekduia sp.]
MADEDQPDHSEDPRKQRTGTGGYPESTPGGSEGGDAGGADPDDGPDAPSPSTDKEADREHTTGNPDAAG